MHFAEFHIGYVAQTQHLSVGVGTYYYVLELFGLRQTAAIFHRVLECLVALLAECARGGLDVLFGEGCRYVGRHKVVLCHDFGFEPYTHRVVCAETHHVTHALHALEYRNDIDFHVVVNEFGSVFSARLSRKRHAEQHRGLAFLGQDAHSRYFGGEQVLSLGHAVLHVDGSHVGVKALFEIHCDVGRAGICGCRLHVGHAFRTVD